jgi:hypothetical protein
MLDNGISRSNANCRIRNSFRLPPFGPRRMMTLRDLICSQRRTTLNMSSTKKSGGTLTCPYCRQVLVGQKLMEEHQLVSCPTSPTYLIFRHQGRENIWGKESRRFPEAPLDIIAERPRKKPKQGKGVVPLLIRSSAVVCSDGISRSRCRDCGRIAVQGSDRCYSCGG